MNNKKTKIVMTTMFRNEATVITRMLESCYKYIDYYVIQNNGSTDGTQKVVEDFFADKNIPGVVYNVEEGWVGFGWNRDHLTQTCQSIDHGCDWILKMDCDEVLEVDDDFDWSVFDDTSIQAFHVPAVSGSCIYHRAWIWNARLPWRFNHDPCHETIYCTIPEIGTNFVAKDLPPSFRQVGYNEGQSWSVPTKFMSDALILEEKMMREGTMLTDMYHFWYIGKSYSDCFRSEYFPLKESQQKEYARRCIYYFEQYVNHTHQYQDHKKAQRIDEMAYMALIFVAEAYKFLKEYRACIATYLLADDFAPGRNDHIFGVAEVYYEIGDYENALVYTTKMMQPERTNAFPTYVAFIDTSLYHDSKHQRVQALHNKVLEKINTAPAQVQAEVEAPKEEAVNPFYINTHARKKLFVVDNFYQDPDAVRNFALTSVEFAEDLRWYKGLRSTMPYRPPGIRQVFESIMNEKLDEASFEAHGYNGCFQICTSKDPQVYHYDIQRWAAMIYLTPNPALESGTRTHRSRISGVSHAKQENADSAFAGGFYDSTKFDIIDNVGNLYNRLVIMDAQSIHSAGPYFGQDNVTGRLTHLFFFD